jgi:hypothetical protein
MLIAHSGGAHTPSGFSGGGWIFRRPWRELVERTPSRPGSSPASSTPTCGHARRDGGPGRPSHRPGRSRTHRHRRVRRRAGRLGPPDRSSERFRTRLATVVLARTGRISSSVRAFSCALVAPVLSWARREVAHDPCPRILTATSSLHRRDGRQDTRLAEEEGCQRHRRIGGGRHVPRPNVGESNRCRDLS